MSTAETKTQPPEKKQRKRRLNLPGVRPMWFCFWTSHAATDGGDADKAEEIIEAAEEQIELIRNVKMGSIKPGPYGVGPWWFALGGRDGACPAGAPTVGPFTSALIALSVCEWLNETNQMPGKINGHNLPEGEAPTPEQLQQWAQTALDLFPPMKGNQSTP